MKKCKKLIKKMLCFVMLSAIVITMSQPAFSYAEVAEKEIEEPQQQDKITQNPPQTSGKSAEENQQYDIVKPVIERVESPQHGQTLKEGDTISLYVYAYDSDSGIKDVRVSASYEQGYSISENVTYDVEKKCYIWEHVLKNISGNKLVINSITITDQADNTTDKSMFENGEYTIWADVEWQKPEATDVQIKNISFKQNGKVVDETEPLEISVETDKEFGIQSMFLTFTHMSSDQRTISIWLRADETGMLFQNKEFCMDINAENGIWTLSDIYVMNIPNRPVNLHIDQIALEDYSFSLKKTSVTETPEEPASREAPIITMVELDSNGNVVSVGDHVAITISAEDNQELLGNGIVSFRAVSNISVPQKQVYLTYNKDQSAYEGTLEITDEMYPCEWYIESIEIRNTAGNLADASSYTAEGNYPYYVLVKNGSTHVSPMYNLCVDFYVLDAEGEWKTLETVQREKIERRQTLKEAGITFPETSAEYPGFTQIGWVDSNGNEITEESQCITASGNMTLYAKYDKKIITIDYQSVSKDGVAFLDHHKMIISQDQTFGELKKAIEGAPAPQESYPGITFQGWKLESADKYLEDAPLPDKKSISFTARAIYDKNVLVVFYKYPVSNEEWRTKSQAIVYEQGESYGDIIAHAIKDAPKISLTGYEFEKWQYKINGPKHEWLEETKTGDAENYMQMRCVAKFSGYTMILIRQIYSTKEGYTNFYYPFYMAKNGTKWKDISESISALKVPEVCENKTFEKWVYSPPELGSSETVKNGFELAMDAQYYLPDIPVDKPTGGDHPIDKPTMIQPSEEIQPGEQQGIQLPSEKISQMVDLINKAEPGIPIQIDMADATVIPKEILEAAKGKNNEIILNMGDYSWKIYGMDIATTDLKSIDLKVVMNTDNIPSQTIQALAGNNLVQQLSLVHHGDFGFKATLTVNVGNGHAGQYGNLYYHDSDGKLIFIDAGKIAPNGNVSLTFSHASDYMIVMSDQKMSQANVPNEFAPARKPGGTQPGENKGQTRGGNKNPTGPEAGTENPSGNPDPNAQDAVQTETISQTQSASNSQNGTPNKSVQTGDEAEAIPLILTGILSLGILIYMWKRQRT